MLRLFVINNTDMKIETDNWPDLSHVPLSGEDDGLQAVIGDV